MNSFTNFWFVDDEPNKEDAPIKIEPYGELKSTKRNSSKLLSKSSDLLHEFRSRISPEVVYFNHQVSLLDDVIQDERQLISVALINFNQKYPNITKEDVLKLINKSKYTLNELLKEQIEVYSSEFTLKLERDSNEYKDLNLKLGAKKCEISELEKLVKEKGKKIDLEKEKQVKEIDKIRKSSNEIEENILKTIEKLTK